MDIPKDSTSLPTENEIARDTLAQMKRAMKRGEGRYFIPTIKDYLNRNVLSEADIPPDIRNVMHEEEARLEALEPIFRSVREGAISVDEVRKMIDKHFSLVDLPIDIRDELLRTELKEDDEMTEREISEEEGGRP